MKENKFEEVDIMKSRKTEIASIVLQSLYCVFCIIDIVFCIIYRRNYDNSVGNICASFALDLTVILFLVPAMPICIALNISALNKRRAEGTAHRGWLAWTIISPIIYIVCCLISVGVLISMTGGV